MSEKVVNSSLDVLRTIQELTEKYGWPPSVREIRDAVGFASTSTVAYHFEVLKSEGLLMVGEDVGHGRRLSRALRITKKGERALKHD